MHSLSRNPFDCLFVPRSINEGAGFVALRHNNKSLHNTQGNIGININIEPATEYAFALSRTLAPNCPGFAPRQALHLPPVDVREGKMVWPQVRKAISGRCTTWPWCYAWKKLCTLYEHFCRIHRAESRTRLPKTFPKGNDIMRPILNANKSLHSAY